MSRIVATPFSVPAAQAMSKKIAAVFPGERCETVEQLQELIVACGWSWDLYSDGGYEIVLQEALRTEFDDDGNEARVVTEVVAVSFPRWPLMFMALQQAFGQALNKRRVAAR